jgi:hypothetical protein
MVAPARVLGPVPSPVVVGGRAAGGSYEGSLGALDFASAASALVRVRRLKRWVYLAFATERYFVAMAIVRLGYAANAFSFVLDKARGGVVQRDTAILPVTSVDVADTTGPGAHATFSFGARRASFRRAAGQTFHVSAAFRGLRLDAELDGEKAPPPISAVAPTEGGLFTTTEKRLLLDVRGDMTVGDDRVSLDGALAGYDYSAGFMPRHTRWKWAFLMGKVDGAPLGLNLVEGFVREAECAGLLRRQGVPARRGAHRRQRRDVPVDRGDDDGGDTPRLRPARARTPIARTSASYARASFSPWASTRERCASAIASFGSPTCSA